MSSFPELALRAYDGPGAILGSGNAKMNQSLPSWEAESDNQHLSNVKQMSELQTFSLGFPKNLTVSAAFLF